MVDFLTKNKNVLAIHRALGVDTFIVGGALRDFFLGEECKDIDMACILSPQEIESRLNGVGIHCVSIGNRTNTITAVFPEEHIEITTFRNVNDVVGQFSGTTIEDDLRARDFTFNAMAINVETGELIDPVNGEQDLKNKTVAQVDKFAFTADPLRILRFFRFASKFGFDMDVHTIRNLNEHGAVYSNLLSQVSPERIRDEFSKILLSDRAASTIFALNGMGFLRCIIPELELCDGVTQNKYHKFDVFEHILETVDRCDKNLTTRLAALFHDIAKPQCLTVDENGCRHFLKHEDVGAEVTEKRLQALKFPSDIISDVKLLVAEHMRPIDCGGPGIRRLIKAVGPLLPNWLDLKRADRLAGHVEDNFDERWDDFMVKLKHEQEKKISRPFETLAIRGQDVLECGVPQGPLIGKILKQLEQDVIEYPELNDKESLVFLAKNYRYFL